MKTCNVCNKEKELNLFVKRTSNKSGVTSYCKECHKDKEANYRKTFSKNKKQQIAEKQKQNYLHFRKKLESGNLTQQEKIEIWLNNWYKHKTQFPDRVNIPKETLRELAVKAINQFPYITYGNVRGKITADFASVDRIDPNLGYSVDNIRIVPFWLNSAKLNLTESQLKERIKHFYEHFCN